MTNQHRLSASERFEFYMAALRIHRVDRCVYVVAELRVPVSPEELHVQGARCLICGRRPESDDQVDLFVSGGKRWIREPNRS